MKLNSLSLRLKILFSVSAAIIIMSISLLVIMRIDNLSMAIIGDSYRSNQELSEFSQDLAQVEYSMESYLNYHTFESIDAFYSYNTKVSDYCNNMQQNPSLVEFKQKEYIVRQIALSFLHYSGKAISSRRANNEEETAYFYGKASDSYRLLVAQLSELNNMLLQKNAETYSNNRNYTRSIARLSLLLYLVFFVLIFTLLYLLISSIMMPLTEISKVALRIADRDFNVPLFNSNAKDEVGNIMKAFDRMIISIREYIDTIWEKARAETEMKEKEVEMQALYADAQLQALQNQINPHFLFNTLNTGAQLAMMEDADKTCYFLEQVSDFFRYNIQQQRQTASVSEELGMVDSFVYIMNVRFGQRLVFEKSIEEGCCNAVLPTMTLQPLVENCIKHGLTSSKCIVKLQVCRNDEFVLITVSDNGEGFDPEIKKQILDTVENDDIKKINSVRVQKSSEHTGIGLINVFYRLKLFFHRTDVYDIQNGDEGTGAKFIIRIPQNV